MEAGKDPSDPGGLVGVTFAWHTRGVSRQTPVGLEMNPAGREDKLRARASKSDPVVDYLPGAAGALVVPAPVGET